MINIQEMMDAWNEHLRRNAEEDMWAGDLGWKALYAEWQAFKQGWEETHYDKV